MKILKSNISKLSTKTAIKSIMKLNPVRLMNHRKLLARRE
jgi:hypothetical protein